MVSVLAYCSDVGFVRMYTAVVRRKQRIVVGEHMTSADLWRMLNVGV